MSEKVLKMETNITLIENDGSKVIQNIQENGRFLYYTAVNDEYFIDDFIQVILHGKEYIVLTNDRCDFYPVNGTEVLYGTNENGYDFVSFKTNNKTVIYEIVFRGVEISEKLMRENYEYI